MVKMNNDYYRSGNGDQRSQWDASERAAPDHVMNDANRLPPVPARTTPPSTIGGALRDQCNINWRSFFLAVTLDNGEQVYFSGPNSLSRNDYRQLFDMDRFLQLEGQRDASRQDSMYPSDTVYYQEGSGLDHPLHQLYRRQDYPDHIDAQMSQGRTRYRTRPTRARRLVDDMEPVPVPARVRRGIKVGDAEALWKYYNDGFKALQQLACKIIGKVFVKAIAPKKQSLHPYTGKEKTAPKWWPKPWGPETRDRVRHIEPDHLLKHERIHLCAHILRLITEPRERQHEDIQRLELTVSKLETATMDAMSSFFSDPQNPKNANKKGILKEIFRIAKQEEKYKKGCIDATTEVYVVASSGASDVDEDDDDDIGRAKTSGDLHDDADLSSGPSSRMSPVRTPSSYMSAMTPRPGPHYSEAMEIDATHHHHHQQHSYQLPAVAPLPTINTMQLDDMISSPNDAGRRSSLYTSPPAPDFPATAAPQIYPTAAWQGAPTASPASSNPAMYAFTSSPHAAGPFAAHPPQQPYMSPSPFGDSLAHLGGGAGTGANHSRQTGNGYHPVGYHPAAGSNRFPPGTLPARNEGPVRG